VSRTQRCTCTGDCGAHRCVGYLTWGKPCGQREGQPHLVTGTHVKLVGGRCQLCHQAHLATVERQKRYRTRLCLTHPNGTMSMFALVYGGAGT